MEVTGKEDWIKHWFCYVGKSSQTCDGWGRKGTRWSCRIDRSFWSSVVPKHSSLIQMPSRGLYKQASACQSSHLAGDTSIVCKYFTQHRLPWSIPAIYHSPCLQPNIGKLQRNGMFGSFYGSDSRGNSEWTPATSEGRKGPIYNIVFFLELFVAWDQEAILYQN